MGKFLVRITIFIISFYIVLSCHFAQLFGVDLLFDWYVPLLELCVVVYCFSEGKYHCKYMKYLALGLFASDLLTRLDNCYNFLTVSEHNFIGICCIYIGGAIALIKAVHPFYKVLDFKQNREKLYGSSGIATNNNN